MANMNGFFKMDTRIEKVITVIASSGHDINTVRQAVMMYIVSKKKKGCTEQRIHEKLEKLELKFKHIEALHPAWRDARALFQLRRSSHIPMPSSIVRERENEQRRQLELELAAMAPSSPVASSSSTYTSPSAPSAYASSSASTYTASTYTASAYTASTYTLSSVSTRPTSVPSIASVLSPSESPSPLGWDSTGKQELPGHYAPSHAHATRRDIAMPLPSEPEHDQEFISQSSNPQN
ncbi:hypothetical protein EDD22DRAFT_845733 [Suillus occidentalis]|nr:hypothetical protein EDD22DRAFT_845733 [Suillus occidentalis]